jgi:hypothetical protein
MGLVFAEAHSALREVEALQDQLLHAARHAAGLQPRDITVMAPDIGAYGGLINAVFTKSRHDPRHIPFSIADRDASAGNAVVQSFLHLLALPESRFAASAVLALLGVPALGARFGIDAEVLESVRARVRDSGIRWGLDGRPAPTVRPDPMRNSWRFGLERMLLGVALDEGAVFEGATPVRDRWPGRIEEIGRLAGIHRPPRALRDCARRDRARWTPGSRCCALLIADFYADDARERRRPRRVARVRSPHSPHGSMRPATDETLTREVLLDMLQQELAARRGLAPVPARRHQLLPADAAAQHPVSRRVPARHERRGLPAQHPATGLRPDGAHSRVPVTPRARRRPLPVPRSPAVGARLLLYQLRGARRAQQRASANQPCRSERAARLHRPTGGARQRRPARRSAAPACHRLKPFHAVVFRGRRRAVQLSPRMAAGRARRSAPGSVLPTSLAGAAIDELTLDTAALLPQSPARGSSTAASACASGYGRGDGRRQEPFALDGLEAWALRDDMLATALAGGDAEACARASRPRPALPHGQAGTGRWPGAATPERGAGGDRRGMGGPGAAQPELRAGYRGLRLHGTWRTCAGAAAPAERIEGHGDTLLQFWITPPVLLRLQPGDRAARVALRTMCASNCRRSRRAATANTSPTCYALYREGQRRPLPLFPKSAWAFAQALRKSRIPRTGAEEGRASSRTASSTRARAATRYIARAFAESRPRSARNSPHWRHACSIRCWRLSDGGRTMIRLDPCTLPLAGRCLIEASAGTGKTYTITSIVLRLLLGARRSGRPHRCRAPRAGDPDRDLHQGRHRGAARAHPQAVCAPRAKPSSGRHRRPKMTVIAALLAASADRAATTTAAAARRTGARPREHLHDPRLSPTAC